KDDDTFWIHEAWGGGASLVLEARQRILHAFHNAMLFERTFVERRNDVTARRARLTPPMDVEKREALLGHRIVALDALAPPLAEVRAGSELPKSVSVLRDPIREAVVVGLSRDPPTARTGENVTPARARHFRAFGSDQQFRLFLCQKCRIV